MRQLVGLLIFAIMLGVTACGQVGPLSLPDASISQKNEKL